MKKAADILSKPLLTTGEVAHLANIGAITLSGWLQRGVCELGEMNRTGRRLFTGNETLQVVIASDLVNRGSVPPSAAFPMAAMLVAACYQMKRERRRFGLIWQTKEGAWAPAILTALELSEILSREPLNHSRWLVPIDDMLIRVETEIVAAAYDGMPWPLPRDLDFGRRMSTDEKGRPVYVGLNLEETEELRKYEGGSKEERQSERYDELLNKHERARLQRIGEAIAAGLEDVPEE